MLQDLVNDFGVVNVSDDFARCAAMTAEDIGVEDAPREFMPGDVGIGAGA